MTHLDDSQKAWIQDVVQREVPQAAGGIYGGPYAVDRFGRACIKEIFQIDVPERAKNSPAKPREAKSGASKPKEVRKQKSPGSAPTATHEELAATAKAAPAND